MHLAANPLWQPSGICLTSRSICLPVPFRSTYAEVTDPKLRAWCPCGAHTQVLLNMLFFVRRQMVRKSSLYPCLSKPAPSIPRAHSHSGPASAAASFLRLSVAVVKLGPSGTGLTDSPNFKQTRKQHLSPSAISCFIRLSSQWAGWPVAPRPGVNKCHLFVQVDVVALHSLSPRKH